jgi:hypothetical protein
VILILEFILLKCFFCLLGIVILFLASKLNEDLKKALVLRSIDIDSWIGGILVGLINGLVERLPVIIIKIAFVLIGIFFIILGIFIKYN